MDFISKSFLLILDMTFTATFIILIISLARVTVLKKLPKIYSYTLWVVVLFRLLCPFSIESSMSIFQLNNYNISKENEIIESKIIESNNLYDDTVLINLANLDLDIEYNDNKQDVHISILNTENIILVTSFIWLLGIIFMILKGIISLYNLKKVVGNSKKINGLYGNIYVSKNISTAIVIGIIFPKIYLPASIENEKSKKYILLHEKIHIKRLDHITRIISYFALCVHWFNPFVWLAFNLSNNDMEMSCDERVIERLNCKSDYATSLLNMAVENLNCPLAFSEGDVKGRIKNMLNYKKPSTIVGIIAVMSLSVTAYTFMTDPVAEDSLYEETVAEDFVPEEVISENIRVGIFDDDYMLNVFSEIFNVDIDDFNVDISVDEHDFEGIEDINNTQNLKGISLNSKNHNRDSIYSVQDKNGIVGEMVYRSGSYFEYIPQDFEAIRNMKVELTEQEKVEFLEIAMNVLKLLNINVETESVLYDTFGIASDTISVCVAITDIYGNADLVYIIYDTKAVTGYNYVDANSGLKKMMFEEEGKIKLIF